MLIWLLRHVVKRHVAIWLLRQETIWLLRHVAIWLEACGYVTIETCGNKACGYLPLEACGYVTLWHVTMTFEVCGYMTTLNHTFEIGFTFWQKLWLSQVFIPVLQLFWPAHKMPDASQVSPTMQISTWRYWISLFYIFFATITAYDCNISNIV